MELDNEELEATRKLNVIDKENEIEVGEYVRTKNGIIDKVIVEYNGKCNNSNCNMKHISGKCNYYDEKHIVKHSKNIIDLIEKGDYVNGMLVTQVAKNEKAINICFYNGLYAENLKLFEADIKSIVTKEQFKSVEFEV